MIDGIEGQIALECPELLSGIRHTGSVASLQCRDYSTVQHQSESRST